MKSKVTGRLKKIFIILMCMTLAVCPVMTETVSAANVKTSNTTVKKKLSGWVKVQRGQVRYYRSKAAGESEEIIIILMQTES